MKTALLTFVTALCLNAQQPVSIRFKAVVGNAELLCGKSYSNIGTTKSTITPRDFRLYVHNVRLLDQQGIEVPVELKQDDKWQLDGVALLDFENATGSCANGTPATNDVVIGTVPAGRRYSGLRFTLGVPFEKNHTDLAKMPSPLNLTALAWVWNAGRKFARLDLSSTGVPRGYAIHLGSTGCTPNETKMTIPTACSAPNRVDVSLSDFDPAKDVILADLASLLHDSNVDEAGKMMSGCMSGPNTPACAPLFSNLGLPFPNQPTKPQTFFRKGASPVITAAIPATGTHKRAHPSAEPTK
jgi:uncharacterized repeat protein (TIGR04052 family)